MRNEIASTQHTVLYDLKQNRNKMQHFSIPLMRAELVLKGGQIRLVEEALGHPMERKLTTNS